MVKQMKSLATETFLQGATADVALRLQTTHVLMVAQYSAHKHIRKKSCLTINLETEKVEATFCHNDSCSQPWGTKGFIPS